MQVLVFGCAYARIADATCSATTLRRRRDEWIAAGVMESLAHPGARGLRPDDWPATWTDVAVDCCITKAPCGGEMAGRSPVDRGKQGLKRSVAGRGDTDFPSAAVMAPANRHDSPLLEPTLDLLAPYRPCADPPTVQLDRGYDFPGTAERLAAYGVVGDISRRGTTAPIAATGRWIIERTHAWMNALRKLVWCTERKTTVVHFWLAFASVVIIVRRLIREGWSRYRWDGRPTRKP